MRVRVRGGCNVCARALQGFTEQIEAKNRIRRMLTHFFPERDCFTMVRPVTDESLLQKLSSTPTVLNPYPNTHTHTPETSALHR